MVWESAGVSGADPVSDFVCDFGNDLRIFGIGLSEVFVVGKEGF